MFQFFFFKSDFIENKNQSVLNYIKTKPNIYQQKRSFFRKRGWNLTTILNLQEYIGTEDYSYSKRKS